jgi:hypothetical protein
MLKLMAAEDSLDEKRLTGTETSPKEIVADAMDLAGMWGVMIYQPDSGLARWWGYREDWLRVTNEGTRERGNEGTRGRGNEGTG